MNKITEMAILAGVVALFAACASTTEPTATVEDRTAAIPVTTPADTKTQPVTQPAVKADPLKDPGSILSKRSIFFEYDKYDIQDQFKSLVEAHAKYLTANPARRVLIQGNCDERGSREYNLALGQKRADAVKKSLMLLGTRDSQIESVSLGEEKPRALGKDEAAYAENRRGDILYNGEF